MLIFQLWIALIALAAILASLLVNIVRALKTRSSPAAGSPTERQTAQHPSANGPSGNDVDPAQPPARMRKLLPAKEQSIEELLCRADAPSGYLTGLEHRLEQTFESYLRERISIETYADIIRSEIRAAHRFQAELSSRALAWPDSSKSGLSPEDEDTFRQIDEALSWCLDWAVERGAAPASFAAPAFHDNSVLG